METKPTYEQARLHLQIFEMRRETRLREARDWFFNNYFVDNLDDAMRLAAPGTESGTFVMMVFGYWDQACALLNYGLLHDDLFFETSGEFSGYGIASNPLSSRVGNGSQIRSSWRTWKKPRSATKPGLKKRSPGHIAAMREFTKQMRAQLKKAA